MAAIDSARSTPSSANAIISGYYRHLSTKMLDAAFPRTLRRHPVNADRSSDGQGNKWVLVYFYMGNAIRTWQDIGHMARALKQLKPGDTTGQADQIKKTIADALVVLNDRVTQLEMVTLLPFDKLYIVGSDSKGWALSAKPPVKKDDE